MNGNARRLWTWYEPVHGVLYFSDEVRSVAAGLGYAGFWMAYFAFRAAPLGAVGPAAATAVCYGFHPSRAARALPDAWAAAPPDAALAGRLAGVDATLRRCWGDACDSPAVADAADLAWEAAALADTTGRTLAAANQALPRPVAPHLALWQAATTLREHRGDGHNAVLVSEGIGPLQAHQLKVAAGETDVPTLRRSRNWPDGEWDAALDALRSRGWIDAGGRLTEAGGAAREHVEARTDVLAEQPWEAAGTAATERLGALLRPLAVRLVEAGAFPLPNPVGVAAPEAGP